MEISVRQFSSDKILKHLDRVQEWLAGGNPAPVTVELDMTNLCNHRCPQCVVNYFRAADNSSLAPKLARKIVIQLARSKIRGLIFTGGGEPLCHPDTVSVVKLAKAKGLDLGFITNGALIDEKIAKVIIDNCTWVRVSLDAGSPKVFKITHGMDGNEFHKVLDRLELLVGVKKMLKSECTVGVGFLTCDSSKADMFKAALLAKKIGVDYLQFRPMQVRQADRFAYHWADMQDKINQCLAYADKKFHVLYSKHKYEMAKDDKFGRYYEKCYGQQFATVVSASGKMYVCCHLRGYEKYCIGDLRRNTFKEIWDSPRRKKVLEKIDFRDCIPLCRDNTFNQILWDIKQPREHKNFL
jgi:radical SAM protein with 4Fe4S-binding SPASM domain